jgi:mannose-1-phosphate guanylyltransferase
MDRQGRIRSFGGRPRPASGRAWLFTGIHVVDPALLRRLPPGPSESVRDLYIPLLAEGGTIRGVPLSGAWYDFGSPSLYLASHMSLLASKSRAFGRAVPRIHPTAKVARSAVVRRSIVGAGCVVEKGAHVVGSVLWDRVRVGAGAVVEGSILGSRAEVIAGDVARGEAMVVAGQETIESTL